MTFAVEARYNPPTRPTYLSTDIDEVACLDLVSLAHLRCLRRLSFIMAASQADYKDRQFLAVIGDEVIAAGGPIWVVETFGLTCMITGLSDGPSASWYRCM